MPVDLGRARHRPPGAPLSAGSGSRRPGAAELPEADQRSLLQALESLRSVLARHPEV
jgi:hypothetical protein